MEWLNDLIWVGNNIYPRWFVLAVILALIAIIGILVGENVS